MVSWNVQRGSPEKLRRDVAQVERQGSWDTIAIQEFGFASKEQWVESAEAEGVDGHMLFVGNRKYDAAVLVHSRWRGLVRNVERGASNVGVLPTSGAKYLSRGCKRTLAFKLGTRMCLARCAGRSTTFPCTV